MTHRIAICTHFSVEHYRGGEKWAVNLANRLAEEPEISVEIYSLPYAPDNTRKVGANDVIAPSVGYTEAWRCNLTSIDTAYVFYHPGAKLSFPGADTYIAGIHSWLYVSPHLWERHYGLVPTAVKLLYRMVGERNLTTYDCVHSVTPAFTSDHSNVAIIPNFVDTNVFAPERAQRNEEFTVAVTAAHIDEKGWDISQNVAERLSDEINVVTTGSSDHPDIQGLGFLSEDELADLYSRTHVVLHPARVDTDSMVINEACASGTPVVTSPLISHVRENEAILHGKTAHEIALWIEQLAHEYKTDSAEYEHRCSVARALAADRSIEAVYPKLKTLLTGEGNISEFASPDQEFTPTSPMESESSVTSLVGEADDDD